MSNYFRRWYILFLLQSLSTRLTRGLIAEYAETRCTRGRASRRGGEGNTNTLTWKSKHLCASFADASWTSGAHRCVPLRNARELCSRCAALFTRWLAARSYVFEHSVYSVSHGIHRSKVYRRVHTHLISTNRELSERNVSRRTRLSRQLLSPTGIKPPFILPSVERKEESSIEEDRRKTVNRISTYSTLNIPFATPLSSYTIVIDNRRNTGSIKYRNLQFEKRHPHTGVARK